MYRAPGKQGLVEEVKRQAHRYLWTRASLSILRVILAYSKYQSTHPYTLCFSFWCAIILCGWVCQVQNSRGESTRELHVAMFHKSYDFSSSIQQVQQQLQRQHTTPSMAFATSGWTPALVIPVKRHVHLCFYSLLRPQQVYYSYIKMWTRFPVSLCRCESNEELQTIQSSGSFTVIRCIPRAWSSKASATAMLSLLLFCSAALLRQFHTRPEMCVLWLRL